MDGIIESAVNAVPVANVEPQQTEPVTNTNEPVNAGNGEVTTPQVESKPVQSAEDNAKYAAIRREAEANAQKQIDAVYSQLFGEQYGIHTKADYDKAVKEAEEQQRIEAESQRMNASPELLKEIEELKAFKNETLAEKQQREQQESVKAVESEVNTVLELAKSEGVEITKEQLVKTALDKGITDLKDAYKLLKPDVDMKTLKENAVKEYIEKLKSGQAPIEASGSSSVVVDEKPKSFDDARKGAAAMLKAAKIFNN